MNNQSPTVLRGHHRSDHRTSTHAVHEGKFGFQNQPEVQSMTEEEVRTIVADFNQNINHVLMENEELKAKMEAFSKQNHQAEEQLNVLEEQNKLLNQEKKHYEDLCNKFETKLDSKEKEYIATELNKLTILKQNDITGEISKYKEVIEASIGDVDQKNTLLELVAEYEKMKQDMIEFSLKFESIAIENDHLREDISKSQKEKQALKQCMRCHEKFAPLLNTEQACVFHHGKLKYYSCRGCGADEYWSCCNRCTVCQKGCREGKHLCL